jgi:hypothetical protein
MAYFERIHDIVSAPFTPTLLAERQSAGWQLVSLEWRRELPGDQPLPPSPFPDQIPYGLRIADDCSRLEVDPTEDRILTLMMDLLVQDFPYSTVVSTLNEGGFRQRDGSPWDRIAVFNMHPRLIEVAPRLFSIPKTEKRPPTPTPR